MISWGRPKENNLRFLGSPPPPPSFQFLVGWDYLFSFRYFKYFHLDEVKLFYLFFNVNYEIFPAQKKIFSAVSLNANISNNDFNYMYILYTEQTKHIR